MPGDDGLRFDKEQLPNANRSTTVRAKPTGHDQPNRGAACEDGSHAAGPRADAGEQESLLAERRVLGNNLGERSRVSMTWKATGRDSVKATISMGPVAREKETD